MATSAHGTAPYLFHFYCQLVPPTPPLTLQGLKQKAPANPPHCTHICLAMPWALRYQQTCEFLEGVPHHCTHLYQAVPWALCYQQTCESLGALPTTAPHTCLAVPWAPHLLGRPVNPWGPHFSNEKTAPARGGVLSKRYLLFQAQACRSCGRRWLWHHKEAGLGSASSPPCTQTQGAPQKEQRCRHGEDPPLWQIL